MTYFGMPGLKYRDGFDGVPTHTPEEVIAAVCKFYKIPQRTIFGDNRRQSTINYRWACQYLLRTVALCKYEYIASMFNMDHSTILYAVKRVEEMRSLNETLPEKIEKIKQLYL